MLEPQTGFLSKYRISSQDFEKTGLIWTNLSEVFEKYLTLLLTYESSCKFISDELRICPHVHSVKWRVKNPEHLIEKIIRKKIASPELEINVSNFQEKITDLAGVRAIHLYKGDWVYIHNIVKSSWKQKSKPIAYIREGDSNLNIEGYTKNGCKVLKHKYGYRSLHYLITHKPTQKPINIEIQVRTIFEEGWSEIDHNIRYPYDLDNPVLMPFLVIFNRLAGSADEISSYLKFLQQHNEDQTKLITDLEDKVNKMNGGTKEIAALKKEVAALKSSSLMNSPGNYSFKSALTDLASLTAMSTVNFPLTSNLNPDYLATARSLHDLTKLTITGIPSPSPVLSSLINPDSNFSQIKINIEKDIKKN
jgi:ppGpp synthetase/RelA/SpoT-type nucleotidyltranferase